MLSLFSYFCFVIIHFEKFKFRLHALLVTYNLHSGFWI